MTFLTFISTVLIFVESSGNDSAVSPDGQCVGCLQLKTIYVDDVNRILGHTVYTYSDRLDRTKSIEMARIYISHYATTGYWQDWAAIHNQGPTGARDPAKQQVVQAYLQRCVEVAKKQGVKL